MYEMDYKDGLVTLRVLPNAGTADCLTAFNEVINAPWHREMLCLLILDEGSAFSPSREELTDIKQLLAVVLSNADAKMAIVVRKVVHCGIGRALEARVDAAGRVRVFMNEQAAREWLVSCAL